MTADRSETTRDHLADGEERAVDPISAVVRAYASRPPYDAVDWAAIAARIVASADHDLERRRAAARWPRLASRGWSGRAWWEVAASWARPAVAAAVVTVALTGVLVASSGATVTTQSEVAQVSPMIAASTDGVDAVLVGSPTSPASSVGAGTITRDSLFAALVTGR